MNEKSELVLTIFAMTLLCLLIFFIATSYFDVAPPAVIDLGKWVSDNTFVLAFTLCFFAACYVIIKLKKKGD